LSFSVKDVERRVDAALTVARNLEFSRTTKPRSSSTAIRPREVQLCQGGLRPSGSTRHASALRRTVQRRSCSSGARGCAPAGRDRRGQLRPPVPRDATLPDGGGEDLPTLAVGVRLAYAGCTRCRKAARWCSRSSRVTMLGMLFRSAARRRRPGWTRPARLRSGPGIAARGRRDPVSTSTPG